MNVQLSLVVLRSTDLAAARQFYEAIGVSFLRESHGTGPEHLAATLNGAVFEIYPVGKKLPTASTRIGLKVTDLDGALAAIEAIGGKIETPASESPWGRRAVVIDPDGHRVELTE